MNNRFPITEKNRVKRARQRASYDKASVYALIDALKTGHVAFVENSEPRCIPMTVWRHEDHLYCHSANKGRFARTLESGELLCLSFAQTHQWVMSKSAYHHSANYESVVLYCRGERLTSEKDFKTAFKAIINQLEPGRWDQVRPPNPKEMKATALIRLNIESASYKSRSGGPVEEDEDLDRPIWNGVLASKRS